jgi:aspartate aminotransferase
MLRPDPIKHTQEASVEALNENQDTIDEIRKEFNERSKYIVEILNTIEGISCLIPDRDFYVFPNVGKILKRGI